MIYRLRYCNKDGVEARIDIQEGLATPVIEVEGTERPFILSYNNDKGDKSGMFLSSSADIEIYETSDFNIDNLKTSNETELSVTHYIDNVISWQGFIIPDFFSIEVRNNPVITMTASDRLGTLKNVTLSDLPSMISLRELAVLCLNKTGLELPLRTMADFNNGTGVNDFFNSKILTQRLSDTKGRSISCYDILSSILTASNSFLVQRAGAWHIINKIQHEAGSGKLYTGATSFINWSDVIFNFSDISTGGRRTIIPVAGSVGIYHEYGGGKLHPDNYDFSQGLIGWTPVGGFVAGIGNQSVNGYKIESGVYVPDYGEAGLSHLKNANPYQRNVNPIYLESAPIAVPYSGSGAVNIEFDINGVGPMLTTQAVMRIAIVAQKGEELLTLHHGGAFAPMPSDNPPVFEKRFKMGFTSPDFTAGADTQSMRVSGTLESSELEGWELRIRIYGGGSSNTILINAASIQMKSSQETPKGAIYKRDQGADFTKAHDIETAIFGDYLTGGLNGYFYDYPIDDTSSLYNSANELTSRWTAYNDPEQLPLLQHITRQRSRLFSVAHDLLSAEIEVNNFDPLAIFVACEKRYTVVSAQFDFFKSNLSVELEEVAFQNANVRDYIYSYFGDGEGGIKSVGGISGSSGGGSGVGLTPEQIEILSFWKKDPDDPNTIFTEMNAYSKLELSAYGVGDGGGGGGGIIETVYGYGNLGQTFNNSILTDTFNAYTINQINTRLVSVENGSASTVNTTGTGNAVTSISKVGSVITANKGLTFSLSNHLHTGVYEPVFSKNTAFNKNFGTTAGTVAEGNHTHSYLPLSGGDIKRTFAGWPNAIDFNASNYINQRIFGVSTNQNTLSFFGDGTQNARRFGIQSGHESPAYASAFGILELNPFGGVVRINGTTAATVNSNVASATKLRATRTIWGQSFDGTGNVSGLATIGNILVGNGSGNQIDRIDGILYLQYASSNNLSLVNGGGNVGIGTTSPTQRLHVAGNILATGEFLATGGLRVNQTAHTGVGISLRGESSANNPVYGMMYAYTASKGTHGAVTGAAATYFTMDSVAGRGWIFTNNAGGTGGNVASISNTGNITASGHLSTTKVIFNSAGWSMEQVGSELQMKHNNVLKMRFTSTGAIVATNEITAFA